MEQLNLLSGLDSCSPGMCFVVLVAPQASVSVSVLMCAFRRTFGYWYISAMQLCSLSLLGFPDFFSPFQFPERLWEQLSAFIVLGLICPA